MNNTAIINFFNSDISNSNVAYIKMQNCQIMATIAYRILKFESTIKKPIVANHAFFTSITFSRISSFTYINSVQDNLKFACLQLYKQNCLNILASNIFYIYRQRVNGKIHK